MAAAATLNSTTLENQLPELIEKIKEVPRKVATKLHQKQVKHMQEQAKAGEARWCDPGVKV